MACEAAHDCLLRFGPPVLPNFASGPPADGHRRAQKQRSAFEASDSEPPGRAALSQQRFSRIVGVESDLSLADIRKQNQKRAENDLLVSKEYTGFAYEDSISLLSHECNVSGFNRSARVLVASTDLDDCHTYLEVQSLNDLSQRRMLVAMLPGRRDIVHASMCPPGAHGEVLIVFTERQHAPGTRGVSLPLASGQREEFFYRLYICATKAPPELFAAPGASFSTTSVPSTVLPSSSVSHLPLCMLDITPDERYSRQCNGNPAYHVAYFIRSDDRKGPQAFLLASDNTEMGLCLQQAQFTSKGHHNSIKITLQEKWGLARNQFWHQWDPHTQRVIFAAHCVQFVKYRMIALDGTPDRRLPLFERNIHPQSVHAHQGSVHPAPFAAGNCTTNFDSHSIVLPIRYECGTEDYALCSQVMRRRKHVRHTIFSSQIVVTVTLLRNNLKEGRICIDVPYRVRSSRSRSGGGRAGGAMRPKTNEASSTAVFAEKPHLSDLIEDPDETSGMASVPDESDEGTPHTRHTLAVDDFQEERDEDWRACFAYVRGMIAVILPHGPIHFIDVAHKEQCPTYLFGSSDTIFRQPFPEVPSCTGHGTCGLQLLRHGMTSMRQQKQLPVVLATLPLPVGNVVYVAGTTAAVSIDLDGPGTWRYIRQVLQHRRERSNYQVLLHTAMHVVTTHIPPRADGYSMNYLLNLLVDTNEEPRTPESPDEQGFSRCTLSPDVLCELLLGECYGRVRAKARQSGCQLHLVLPMVDDHGILERQEELYSSLRLSCAAARVALANKRARRKTVANALAATPPPTSRTPPPAGGLAGRPSLKRNDEGSPEPQRAHAESVIAAVPAANATTLMFPHFRFHYMLHHAHKLPPIPADNSDGNQLERPYSFGTTCAPSERDVQGECSLTSNRWWTNHVLVSQPRGFLKRIISKQAVIPIQRISFRRFTRDMNVPFGRYMETLLLWHGVPLSESKRLVAWYVEAMTTLLDDLVEVVSQPPYALHPHKQVLFLLNLCSALETIQFPWKGPLRQRFAKLLLDHVPTTLLVGGIKSKTIPVELNEVIVAFRQLQKMSPWIQNLVDSAMTAADKRMAASKQLAAQRRTSKQENDSDEDGDDASSNADEASASPFAKSDALGRQASSRDYHRCRYQFAPHLRLSGVMHCAGTLNEQRRFAYSTLISCSSLNGTSVSFDDVDKQTVMAELFTNSTLQFHRNQLPLDGFLPNFQPLRSFANSIAVKGEDTASRRMQPPAMDVATTRDIVKPDRSNRPHERDLAAHKRRLAEDAFTVLIHPFAAANSPQLQHQT